MNKKAVIEYVDYGRAIGVLLDLARDYGDMDECTEETIKMCIRALNRLPTLTPESLVKWGRWIEHPSGDPQCSECRERLTTEQDLYGGNRFCPYCGCKMVEKAEAALTPTPASDVPEGE